jgi:hypothetical protein
VVSLIGMGGDHPIRAVAVSSAELCRLLGEAGFGAALKVAWRGQGSLDDAVHRRRFPTTPAPSGRADPAAQLGELRARVYGRPQGDEPMVEVSNVSGSIWLSESEARLLLLERQLEHDGRVLDNAVDAARRAITPAVIEPEEASPPQPPSGLFARVLRQHPVLVFSATAALLTALVVPATATVFAPALTTPAGLLKVFNRPQGTIDIAPRVFTGGQPGSRQRVRDTTRLLGTYYGVAVFAYLNSSDEVCLLSTAPGDHDVTVCSSVGSFARSGLSIAPVNYHVDYTVANAAAGVTATSRLAFRWGPDADLAVRVVG